MKARFPPKNSILTFREPFLKTVPGESVKCILACVDDTERLVKIEEEQQLDIIDYLLLTDKKLTNAVVDCDSQGRFTVLRHSPQEDFFDLVRRKNDSK